MNLKGIIRLLHDFYEVYLLEECSLFKRITKDNLVRVASHLCYIYLETDILGGICNITIVERIGKDEYKRIFFIKDLSTILEDNGTVVTNKSFIKSVVSLLYGLDDICSSIKRITLRHPLYTENKLGLLLLEEDNGDLHKETILKG